MAKGRETGFQKSLESSGTFEGGGIHMEGST